MIVQKYCQTRFGNKVTIMDGAIESQFIGNVSICVAIIGALHKSEAPILANKQVIGRWAAPERCII